MFKYLYLTLLLTTSLSLAVNTTALEKAIFSHDYALAEKEVAGLAIPYEKIFELLSVAEKQIVKLRDEIDYLLVQEGQFALPCLTIPERLQHEYQDALKIYGLIYKTLII